MSVTREAVIDAVAHEVLERGAKAAEVPFELATAVADRLELAAAARAPAPAAAHVAPERGLLIAGEVIPGTDWVRRDPRYWWTSGRGTRPRARVVDLLVGHWTAGEAGTRDPDGAAPLTEYDDDGPRVVRVMRSRKRNGRPLNVGIHFVIGACDPSESYAPIWQTADPGEVARRSISGPAPSTRARSASRSCLPACRDRSTIALARACASLCSGGSKEVLAFFPGQLRTWVALAEAIARLEGRAGVHVPRRVPSFGAEAPLQRRGGARLRGSDGAPPLAAHAQDRRGGTACRGAARRGVGPDVDLVSRRGRQAR
ncbi:MAG: hypothetical protein SangKO_011590 [Sandaracinaceae bacterium]